MLLISEEQQAAIYALDRTRTDGGLGSIVDADRLKCRDVRNDPVYADYWPILATARPEPVTVTALQGLLAIDAAGLSSQYEAWITDPARTFAERAFIQRAQTWQRDNPTLIAAATSLSLTELQIDGLFNIAKTM